MSSSPVTALLPPDHPGEAPATDPAEAGQHPEHPADPGIPAPASDHARDATDGQHAPNDALMFVKVVV